DPYDADLQPPEDLHMATTLHADDGSGRAHPIPDNLDQPPLDYSDPNDRRTSPLPPLDEETVPADQVTLSEAEMDQELFWATQRRGWTGWKPTDAQQQRRLDRIADAELAPISPERIANLNERAAAF